MDTEAFNRAIALRDAGKVKEALREFVALAEATVDLEEKAALLGNQCTCLTILGLYQEARKQLTLALSIAPKTQCLLYHQYVDAALSGHEGQWSRTLQLVERLLEEYGELLLQPEHRRLYQDVQVLRGATLVAHSRFREARTVLEECLRLNLNAQDEREVLSSLGTCYINLGEKGRAKEMLLKALEKGLGGGNAVSAHYHLGTIYFAETAYAKAWMEFEWCLAHVKEGLVSSEHLCGWLAATANNLGMKEEADRYRKLAEGTAESQVGS